MPTGYTADVIDKNISFRQFALNCTRAFGATILLRDEPMDKTFTEVPKQTYHEGRVAESIKEFNRFTALDYSDQLAWARTEIGKRKTSAQKYVEDARLETQRLTSMIDQVRSWTAPTDEHVRYKEFMLEQLTMSLSTGGWAEENMASAEKLVAADLVREHVGHLGRDIQYHTKGQKDDEERNAKSNAWLKAVIDSLPAESE